MQLALDSPWSLKTSQHHLSPTPRRAAERSTGAEPRFVETAPALAVQTVMIAPAAEGSHYTMQVETQGRRRRRQRHRSPTVTAIAPPGTFEGVSDSTVSSYMAPLDSLLAAIDHVISNGDGCGEARAFEFVPEFYQEKVLGDDTEEGKHMIIDGNEGGCQGAYEEGKEEEEEQQQYQQEETEKEDRGERTKHFQRYDRDMDSDDDYKEDYDDDEDEEEEYHEETEEHDEDDDEDDEEAWTPSKGKRNKPASSSAGRVRCSRASVCRASKSEQTATRSAKTSHKSSSRFMCNWDKCGKSFTTSGHLARHARIHAGVKPYKCILDGCPKRFSRQDNMMQHYRAHVIHNPLISPPPTPLTETPQRTSSKSHSSSSSSFPSSPSPSLAEISTLCDDGLPQLFNCPQKAAVFWSRVRASQGMKTSSTTNGSRGGGRSSKKKRKVSLSTSSDTSTAFTSSSTRSSAFLSVSPPPSSSTSPSPTSDSPPFLVSSFPLSSSQLTSK